MEMEGARIVVAGAGGAARAVVHACLTGGAAHVHVANRNPERAGEVQAKFGDGRVGAGGLDESFSTALRLADLAVNTTTVGMTTPGLPFDVGMLPDRARIFDLVYVPAVTPLIETARARGLDAVNGLGMLVAQAAIAFERWTGVSGAETIMRQAVEEPDQSP